MVMDAPSLNDSESAIYFIQKEAVYYHGIFWIGFDYNEGVVITNSMAHGDKDDHHNWVLYRYTGVIEPTYSYIPHEEVYRVNKRDLDNEN
jgi:hypothetical protein